MIAALVTRRIRAGYCALRDIAAPVVATELRRLAGVIGLIRELLSAARDGYLDAMQDHAPEGRRVVQATDSWFAPAIPVLPPTGEVRVRRARPDGPDTA